MVEICKTLPPDARAGVQQQLEKLRATAADGEGGFAVSVTEICDQFPSEIRDDPVTQQTPLPASSLAGEGGPPGTLRVAEDIALKRLKIVNVIFVGTRESRRRVLVDAGLPGIARRDHRRRRFVVRARRTA